MDHPVQLTKAEVEDLYHAARFYRTVLMESELADNAELERVGALAAKLATILIGWPRR